MKVINLFSGPGTGKSTTAAGLFYEMKKMGENVELVQEYAKDLIWEKRYNILEDQIYVFAKQQRRIARLRDHDIDWVITDSPISLGLAYTDTAKLPQNFFDLVMSVFLSYDNFNYVLSRNVAYNPVGRMQDSEQAVIFDQKVRALLDQYQVSYKEIVGGEPAVSNILNDIGLLQC